MTKINMDDFDKAFARDYFNTFIDGLRDLTDDEKEDTVHCIPAVAFEALLLLFDVGVQR